MSYLEEREGNITYVDALKGGLEEPLNFTALLFGDVWNQSFEQWWERASLLGIKGERSYVVPGRGGDPRKDLYKGTRDIADKAGLPKDFRPVHGLCYVYASMLASSGEVDLYTLQKLLTHKSLQMTQRYAHLRDEALKKASDLAGELINEIVREKPKKTVTRMAKDRKR